MGGEVLAINKVMMAALKALSYVDIGVKDNYPIDRLISTITHPSIKQLYKAWDHRIIVDGYELTVRVFQPKEQRSPEILLFFHGGGWVSGNVENYTKTCGDLAELTGRRVLSLDYRLAPEYPFPYAAEDCYRVAKELFLNTPGVRAEDIVLIGDSAGGNLAAVTSLMAADRREFRVRRQVLIYPLTYNDHTEDSPYPSVRENSTGYLLTSKRIRDYIDLYLKNDVDRNSPYFAPMLSDHLEGQPETLIITAEFDPLRDEGEAYGEKLRQFGNAVETVRFPDALHGFFSLPVRFAQVRQCYETINRFLDRTGNANENQMD